MLYNIGADVGGTFIKCALTDEKGNVITAAKAPTPEGPKVPEVVCRLAREVTSAAKMDMKDINSVGIGTTGICDSEKGVVISGVNIKNYENIDMCGYVTKELGVPAYLDNDANCAALGEYMAHGGDGDFIFVTLGTGVGGGIILSGRLLRGINGGAGEIGHMTIESDGEKCNCGRRGCWEQYASVSALVKMTKAAGFDENSNGRTAFEKAAAGDERAKKVIEKWLYYVAVGICDLINIFQPQTIVIGGGVSREGDRILLPVKKFVGENIMTKNTEGLKQTEIKISKLFNDAGVVGAGFLYRQR